MVIGMGLDIEEVARFANWHTFSRTQLRRIFSEQEIDYCLAVPAKSAQRFAVRFVAREALYKALCQARDLQELANVGVPAQGALANGKLSPIFLFTKIPFLALCKMVRVEHSISGVPYFAGLDSRLHVLLSLSHSSSMAVATVIVQRV